VTTATITRPATGAVRILDVLAAYLPAPAPGRRPTFAAGRPTAAAHYSLGDYLKYEQDRA
jgi:hypothetical protein